MKLRSEKIKSNYGYDLIKHEDYIYLSIKDWRITIMTHKFKQELLTEIRETFGFNLRVSVTEYYPEPETTIHIYNERNFYQFYNMVLLIGRGGNNTFDIQTFYTCTWQFDIKIERYVQLESINEEGKEQGKEEGARRMGISDFWGHFERGGRVERARKN
jgi:hypothetical protein